MRTAEERGKFEDRVSLDKSFSEHEHLRLDRELYASSLAAMTPKQLSGLGVIVIRL